MFCHIPRHSRQSRASGNYSEHQEGQDLTSFKWSPDGKYIAFLSPDEESEKQGLTMPIYIMGYGCSTDCAAWMSGARDARS